MVVEDYQPFRQLVCSKLKEHSELRVICEASDGFEAVQKAEQLMPDLILLDIGLPTLSGIEAARRILEHAPGSKIIFVTLQTSPAFVQEAMRLGAWGYIFKTDIASNLLRAISDVLSGRHFISRAQSDCNGSTLDTAVSLG